MRALAIRCTHPDIPLAKRPNGSARRPRKPEVKRRASPSADCASRCLELDNDSGGLGGYAPESSWSADLIFSGRSRLRESRLGVSCPTTGVPQVVAAKRDYLRPEFVGASILLRRRPCASIEDESSQLLETLEG